MSNIDDIVNLKNEIARSKGFLDWDDLTENSSEDTTKSAEKDFDRKYSAPDSGYDDFDA